MRATLLALLLLVGCASPDPAIYTLAPVPSATAPFAGSAAPKLVELRRPGLAGYLDRSEIVRANADYQIKVNGGERWGEPFGDMVARVLAEDLNARLPGTSVFTSAGSISALPDASIELDLQRLDPGANGQVMLLMQVAVSRGNSRGATTARTIRLTVTPGGPSAGSLVAAESVALGQAADQIAEMVRGR